MTRVSLRHQFLTPAYSQRLPPGRALLEKSVAADASADPVLFERVRAMAKQDATEAVTLFSEERSKRRRVRPRLRCNPSRCA